MEYISEWINEWNNSISLFVWFILLSLLTLFFSLKMVKYAELIIQKTKLGGAFVGLIFISLVTSIPELITEISQGLMGKPDVGISDDIGSNAFSMFALSIIILIFIKKLYISKLSSLTIKTIIISLFISILITFILKYQLDIRIGKVGYFAIGIVPIFLFLFYLFFVFFIFKNRHLADPEPEEKIKSNLSIKKIVFLFILFSLLLIFIALSLNWTASAIQTKYNIPSNSTGGLLLSITTSLPEIIALIAFAKKGFLTAAIGSIVGSHIFNFSILFWGDISFSENASILFDGVQKIWIMSVMTTIEIFLFLIFVLAAKKTKNKLLLSTLPITIILVYITGWILILTQWS